MKVPCQVAGARCPSGRWQVPGAGCQVAGVRCLRRHRRRLRVYVATAMAQFSGSGASQADLAPRGRLQGFLPCKAGSYIKPTLTCSRILRPQLPNCLTPLHFRKSSRRRARPAISHVGLGTKMARLKFLPAWPVFCQEGKPAASSARTPLAIWLRLENRHYCNSAMPANRIAVQTKVSVANLCGAASCAKLLGLVAHLRVGPPLYLGLSPRGLRVTNAPRLRSSAWARPRLVTLCQLLLGLPALGGLVTSRVALLPVQQHAPGMTASELKGLTVCRPWLVAELADLLKGCMQAVGGYLRDAQR